MKKSLTKFLSLIAVAGAVFFSSCSTTEDAASVLAPTITIADAGNGNYENGDNITYTITAAIPGGLKILNFTKTVDGTEGAATGVNGPAAGDTAVAGTVTIPVTEDEGKTVTITVNVIDNNDQTASATATYTVVGAGQGGGGAIPLVQGSATLSLGTQGASAGSYLSTATNGSTVGEVFGATDAQTNVAKIDIFFGATTSAGGVTAGSGSGAITSMLSPSEVTDVNSWTGITGGRVTSFAAASGVTDLNVSAINVENNISTTGGSSAVAITQGSVYSFVTADGKKGYILIEKITDNGVNASNLANRTVDVKFVVQQ